MNWRRGLWLALLVYVAFDAAVPDMPGAFVFDPDASVDGTDTRRVEASEVVGLPWLTRDDALLVPPAIERPLRPRPRALPPVHYAVRTLPRADGAASSEDPH